VEEPERSNPVIRIEVADMLSRIESKLDTTQARIETKLDSKADKADLVAIWSGLDHHTKEISSLKEEAAARRVAEEARTDHASAEAQERARRRDTVYGLLMLMLTAGLVLGAIGIHI
jgi:uncharacterized membrane protein YdbT with pleckstrin-like domain